MSKCNSFFFTVVMIVRMITIHVSSQPANQRARETPHARAVKPTWHALCCSSNASNVHKPLSTFSDINIIWHAHPRSNLPDVYLTDRWRYRYTLVCKHNRCRWQLYGVVVFIKYVFNTCRRANETATLQIKLMWIARAANVQAV